MRRLTILLFAVLLALAGVASPELLAPPAFGDPTRMRAKAYANTVELHTAFFGDGNATNFTLLCWMRWTPRGNMPGDAQAWLIPFINVSVSADPARATKEGGPELENLCSHRYDVPLTLSGGTWGTTCLPATYDYPPSCSDWQYGCYCVNVETDTALTVNVGGAEQNVAASNGVRQVFNIKAESASRAVSISAANNNARVKFGIAENPLVQFIGSQFDSMGADTAGGHPDKGGIASTEWRLVVARGMIATNCVTINVCGYNASSKFESNNTVSQALWHPRSTFAKHARIRMTAASCLGLSADGQEDVITLYGYRVYRGWMSEADILRMRDLDVAEMTRRGM